MALSLFLASIRINDSDCPYFILLFVKMYMCTYVHKYTQKCHKFTIIHTYDFPIKIRHKCN